jgi:hypothetical protein
VAQLVEALRYKFTGSISHGVIGIFHSRDTSGRTMALGFSNRNEYQEYFLGVKAAGA